MISRTDGGLTIVVCERTDPISWSYFPYIVLRAQAFIKEYDADANPQIFADVMVANFAAATPSMIAIGLINESGFLVGHLVVQIEDYMGSRFATIIQLEVDSESALKPEVIAPAYDWIKGWAAKCGAKRLQCMARNDAVARLFRQRYGFEKKRVLMTLALATDGENVVQFPAPQAENQG